MLKNTIVIVLLIIMSSCNPKDCFQSTGEIIEQEIVVANFTKIKVGNEIRLILKQGTTQKVIIKTGKNLIDEVKVVVINDKLYVEDNNSCNLTRDYAVTQVIVISPNITEIRSDTARKISSEGVLNYENIKLISEDFIEDALTNGDFDLTLNSQSVTIVANGNSIYNIKGNTINLLVGFYAGSSRFNGDELLANNVTIVQKSTNDILLNPQLKIEGTIYNLGDVICNTQPAIINVEELYTGRLIFN